MYANRNTRQSEQAADSSKYPQKRFNPKPCRECGYEFTPNAPSHLYCSQQCADRAYASRYLERQYGIRLEDYERMHQQQGGGCYICGSEGFKINPHSKVLLAVDHCHDTGRVRGLLCHNCNRALGLLGDNISNLKSAIEYLKVQRPSETE